MLRRVLIHAVLVPLVASTAMAQGACDVTSTQQYQECLQLVSSLRPDKAGQARVFARDGSEFTAGQAIWMQKQLNKVARLCSHNTPAEQAEAANILADVQQLLKSHQRKS